MPPKTPPPPPPRKKPDRRPAGYQIRGDLDDAVRAYAEQESVRRQAIIDAALEDYLSVRHMWSPAQ